MKNLWLWIRNKFGRLVTAVGGVIALADLDISPIKDNLEAWLTHKEVQAVTIILFVASYLRHHWVAQQNPK